MFTHFRPAAKKQAPNPTQNKNSVYIKYGYFMGNPAELAAQRQARAGVSVPETEETVIPDTEIKSSDIGAVSYVEVNEQTGISKPFIILKKKPFILYRKAKGTKGIILTTKSNNYCTDIHVSASLKSNRLYSLVITITPCCRGGPVIS